MATRLSRGDAGATHIGTHDDGVPFVSGQPDAFPVEDRAMSDAKVWTVTTPQDRTYVVTVNRGPDGDGWRNAIVDVTSGGFTEWDRNGQHWFPTAYEAYGDACTAIWSHEEENDDA